MRDQFPGYYRPSAAALTKLWKDAIVVVDTSVLLDVFRVSEGTALQLLSTLEKLASRLWIPHHVAYEYHTNLEKVIADQAKPYDDATKQLTELINAFAASRKHPFLGQALLDQFKAIASNVEAELKSGKGKVLDLLTENPFKERIARLFAGRVGAALSADDLAAIYEDGKRRFADEIPPGYADRKDKPEPRCYGDLVIWKSVLSHCAAAKQPCLMVTADVKEDWFQRLSGRTLGPRPELVSEFHANTKKAFSLYSTAQFLELAAKYVGATVAEEAIQEVRDVSRARLHSNLAIARSRMAIRNQLMQHFGVDPHESTVVKVSGALPLWVARLPDGRRVILEEGHPERFAVFTPWPDEPHALHVSDGLSALAPADEVGRLPWVAEAFAKLEQRHQIDLAQRSVVRRIATDSRSLKLDLGELPQGDPNAREAP